VTADEGLFAVLYVTRTGGSTGAVDLSYGTVDGSAGLDSDFERPTTPLHWEDGDTSPKPIVVPIILDAVTEPDETFRVWLRDPSGGATLGNTMMATVTILDAPSSSTCMTCPRSPTASATQSGGGGSLGPLDLLWLALATLLTRATKLNGDRARSRRPARADDR
jgi:hypothetical protein